MHTPCGLCPHKECLVKHLLNLVSEHNKLGQTQTEPFRRKRDLNDSLWGKKAFSEHVEGVPWRIWASLYQKVIIIALFDMDVKKLIESVWNQSLKLLRTSKPIKGCIQDQWLLSDPIQSYDVLWNALNDIAVMLIMSWLLAIYSWATATSIDRLLHVRQ